MNASGTCVKNPVLEATVMRELCAGLCRTDLPHLTPNSSKEYPRERWDAGF